MLFDLCSLFAARSAPLTLYMKCCANVYTHTYTHIALPEINYFVLGLLCSPGKVGLYSSTVIRYKRQAVQKEKLVSSPGHCWWNALEMCGITGCFDVLERRAQEASLSSPSQHVEHVMHMM